jgi:hypothetical protein
MFRSVHLQKLSDDELVNLVFPYLERNRIQMALNTGGATFAQAAGRDRVVDRDLEQLQRIKDLGGTVDYVSLQSALSKPLRREGEKIEYPMDRRLEDVVAFASAAREIFPGAAIGVIDALLSHGSDYREPYRQLKAALAEEGLPLSYIHLDISFDAPRTGRYGVTWDSIAEMEDFIEGELGAEFGIFAKSRRAGQRSSEDFHHRVIDVYECYSGAGGTPSAYILAGNFAFPNRAIPEDGPDYTAMRTVLEFGELLEEQAPALREGDQAWNSQCVGRERGRRKEKRS